MTGARIGAVAVLVLVGGCITRAALHAGSLSDIDAKYGFRDLQFGSAPTDDLKLLTTDGDTQVYARPNDDLHIGQAALDHIDYGFYKHLFSAAHIHTKAYANSAALLEVLRQAYGPGYQPNQFMQKFFWFGNRVVISYERSPISDDADAFIRSKPLLDQEQADKKENAKKGVGDL